MNVPVVPVANDNVAPRTAAPASRVPLMQAAYAAHYAPGDTRAQIALLTRAGRTGRGGAARPLLRA